MRIRFKAAVHSGALVDSLNDCSTKYCLAFEEQHWLRKKDGEEDPNSIKERLLRLTKILHDQGAPHSPPRSALPATAAASRRADRPASFRAA
eukprot:4111256-Prymnesium_polylepis.1